ncbi:hypothetical protein FHT82_002288 [Rhizobium sp. BK275]|uniref:hypothetical protein n=1 Tax=Rhizobium sp. BK275 TaxID=2587077 RepID=UPI0016090A68|nr:hypothetical protein [Rhizobium sp. BK275]MBB3389548.1 hypothetical protein [Rhizobium sp. BK275]
MKIALACIVFAAMLVGGVDFADARRRDRDENSPRRTCEQMQQRLSHTSGGKRPGNEVEKKAKMMERMRKRGCI